MFKALHKGLYATQKAYDLAVGTLYFAAKGVYIGSQVKVIGGKHPFIGTVASFYYDSKHGHGWGLTVANNRPTVATMMSGSKAGAKEYWFDLDLFYTLDELELIEDKPVQTLFA
jgi:hypothetical protein